MREDAANRLRQPHRWWTAVGTWCGPAAAPRAATADAYPNRSIKIVVPFPAGGPSDVLARMIGQKMTEDWGQPVVIENRVGANTVIGAQQVAKAAPDGYTLLMAIDSHPDHEPVPLPHPPYDPFNDFVPITLTAKSMVFMYVNAASDVKTVDEVIARAQGAAGQAQLRRRHHHHPADLGHLFNKAAGTKTVLVTYNGSAEVAQGLLTKSVDFTFDGTSASMPLVQSGQFRALAKFDSRRFRRCRTSRPPPPSCRTTRRSRSGSGWSRPRARRRRDHRQAPCRGRQGAGRSRHQGEGGRLRAVPGDHHAGGIRRLHPQGGRALVDGREGNRTAVRLIARERPQSGRTCRCSHPVRRPRSGRRPGLPPCASTRPPKPASTAAQTYPNRTVRIVVPFPAGGPTDILSRVIAQRLSEVWGQPVVIENQPGANTAIAAARVAKLPADGYTLLAAMDVTMVLNPVTNKSLSYDPLKDFAPITLGSKNTSLLTVRAEDGPKTVKELIARAKANPGKLNYGAGIITTRLAGYLFNREAGIEVQYIPFSGSPPTVQGLLNGAVDYIVDGTATSLPLIQGGKLRRSPSSTAARSPPCPRSAARRRRRAAGARRHLDLDRLRRAGRHAAAGHRQDPRRDREDVRRPRHRRQAREVRHQRRHQHAGGVRGLRAQGTRALGAGVQGWAYS